LVTTVFQAANSSANPAIFKLKVLQYKTGDLLYVIVLKLLGMILWCLMLEETGIG